jgi:hypothetical protein
MPELKGAISPPNKIILNYLSHSEGFLYLCRIKSLFLHPPTSLAVWICTRRNLSKPSHPPQTNMYLPSLQNSHSEELPRHSLVCLLVKSVISENLQASREPLMTFMLCWKQNVIVWEEGYICVITIY